MPRFFPAVFCLSLFCPVNAQQFLTLTDAVSDKPDYNAISEYQTSYLNALYIRKVDLADELIEGREYIPYYLKCRITPLFFDGEKRKGSLLFNGRKYNNLKLEYDTFLDQLIYSDSSKLIDDKVFKIALNKDPVDEFGLYFSNDSMIFRHFRNDAGEKFNLPEGFYEVVYDGLSKFIIRHQSSPIENDGIYEYRYSTSDYVMVGDNFFRVRSSGSFVKLFGKDSDAIRKFMRTNRVHFRSADKKEVAAVLRYYDTLIMSKE